MKSQRLLRFLINLELHIAGMQLKEKGNCWIRFVKNVFIGWKDGFMNELSTYTISDQIYSIFQFLGRAHVLNIHYQYWYLLHNHADPWNGHYKYKQQVGIVLS